MECDDFVACSEEINLWFQSTHSHGVRLNKGKSARQAHNFNQRTRMECDDAVGRGIAVLESISINALAWSATVIIAVRKDVIGGFQSTHSHGVRLSVGILKFWVINFNQRTRMECDNGNTVLKNEWGISINALAWSATNLRAPLRCALVHFNQRTRMECDCGFWPTIGNPSRFQSTHSHGVRHALNTSPDASCQISINALAWSATLYPC